MMAANTYYGTGKRKSSIARVWMKPGTGTITVNSKSLDEYFGRETSKMIVRQPLELVEKVPEVEAALALDVVLVPAVERRLIEVQQCRAPLLPQVPERGHDLCLPGGDVAADVFLRPLAGKRVLDVANPTGLDVSDELVAFELQLVKQAPPFIGPRRCILVHGKT